MNIRTPVPDQTGPPCPLSPSACSGLDQTGANTLSKSFPPLPALPFILPPPLSIPPHVPTPPAPSNPFICPPAPHFVHPGMASNTPGPTLDPCWAALSLKFLQSLVRNTFRPRWLREMLNSWFFFLTFLSTPELKTAVCCGKNGKKACSKCEFVCNVKENCTL